MNKTICKKNMYLNRDKIIKMENIINDIKIIEDIIENQIKENLDETNNIKIIYENINRSYKDIQNQLK
jgi:hypothetical protein